jgi:hypothetical protein
MLVIEGSTENFIRIRAIGLLGAPDYRRFEPEFESELKRRKVPVLLLLDMRGFRGWTAAGFVHDLLWDIRNRNSFSKIAVVGNAVWHRWITILGMPLFRAPMKFFRAAGEKRARVWLEGRKLKRGGADDSSLVHR